MNDPRETLAPNHPSLEEVRRHWGLAVDIHRRPERLAEFDRMICSLMAEAWDQGAEAGERDYATALDPGHECIPNPYRKEGNA